MPSNFQNKGCKQLGPYILKSPHDPIQPDLAVASFWDNFYRDFNPTTPVERDLELPPGALPLSGCNILIVACGTGADVVRACRQAREVTAIDISSKAVENARAIAEHNNCYARYVVADAGRSGLEAASFDVIWGTAVLHHLMHEEVASEFARILKPGGTVYMLSEPTFFNPLLKLAYEFAFGKGRHGRKRQFLIFRRRGDDFEKPIEESDLEHWRHDFKINARPRGFMFFEKIGHVLSRSASAGRLFAQMDKGLLAAFPGLKKYSYEFDFIFVKK